ncbi:hypothetical protein MLD38_032069 [Melastoma candidum]|uniref:Uncharacterized protein n=1 Tax=Melastoma candidum TaxID=119954 RepID=A0ACB9M6N9_9MYRT|nr:hypothetical protein MLD38_032069 [Melastoma candidum]
MPDGRMKGNPALWSISSFRLFPAFALRAVGCSCRSLSVLSTCSTEFLVNDSTELLRRWGCSEDDLSKLLQKRPSLRKADPYNLHSKLRLLSNLGITGSDLVKVINCRPRFLSNRLHHNLESRINFFMSMFGSREMLRKAIIRNPSLLTYDFHGKIVPAIQSYEDLGLSKEQLMPLLLSRPTLIPRTSFEPEKLDIIRKTAVARDSKVYKHFVAIMGISRLGTIREKIANLEKFGLSEDEVLGLFGKSPVMLTFSVDKIQRNMTFILGTLKLPAKVILEQPFLLNGNLELSLRPRFLLGQMIQERGLHPQIKGPSLFRALRMTEPRFLKGFIHCHPDNISDELLEYYNNCKGVRRLAEASKKNKHKGFPF